MSTSIADLSSRERRLCRARRKSRPSPRRSHGGDPTTYTMLVAELVPGVQMWHQGAWHTVTDSPAVASRTRVQVGLRRRGLVEFCRTAIVAVRS